jgi:predicted Zn-dependent protease
MAKQKTAHRPGWRLAAVLVFSLPLSGCLFAGPSVRKISLPNPPKQVLAPRDHQRILAAYGGAYHDPRLQAFIARIVTRLAYIAASWIEGVDPGSIEELVVNGFPAVTATAQSDHWSYRLYVVRFGVEVYRIVFSAREKTAEADQTFRESFNTFRHLRLSEIETAKPLRLAIVTVGAGDTVEQLASRMSMAEHPLEHFRVLNGLAPDQIVQPGDRVKILME